MAICVSECLDLLSVFKVSLARMESTAAWGCPGLCLLTYGWNTLPLFLFGSRWTPHIMLPPQFCVHSCRALRVLYACGVARNGRQAYCTYLFCLKLSVTSRSDSRELNWTWGLMNVNPLRLHEAWPWSCPTSSICSVSFDFFYSCTMYILLQFLYITL